MVKAVKPLRAKSAFCDLVAKVQKMANTCISSFLGLVFCGLLFCEIVTGLENVSIIFVGHGAFSAWSISLPLLCNSIRIKTDNTFALQDLFSEELTIYLLP